MFSWNLSLPAPQFNQEKNIFNLNNLTPQFITMKKIYQALALAGAMVAGGFTSSCSFFGSEDAAVEYMAVQIDEDGNWSFMNTKGELVLEDEFKNQPSGVANGYFSVKEGEKYVLYKFDEKKPTVVVDELMEVGYVAEGLVPTVTEKNRIAVLKKSGEQAFVLDPVKGKEIISSATGYSDGMLLVRNEDYKLGFVNTKGECVIVPKYDSASEFSEGLAVVGEEKEVKDGENETKFSVIDKKGEVAFTLAKNFTPYSNFNYGLMVARDKNEHPVFLDKKGEVVTKCPAKVKYVNEYNKDMYVFGNEDYECGVMTMDGETILRPKYDYITFTEDGDIVAADDDKAEVFNSKGESQYVINDYKNVRALGAFGIVGKDKKTYQFFDKEGKPIKNAEFNDYSASLSLFNSIHSDYFNMEGAVASLVNNITDTGYGKYKFGATPQSVKGGEPTYSESYSTRLELEDMPKGYRFSTSGYAMFSESMARYDYNPYTYSGDYRWNADSKLEGVDMYLNAETVMGKSAVEAFTKALEAKGFKKIAATNDKSENAFASLLAKGDTVIGVFSEKDSYRVNVTVIKDASGLFRSNAENVIRRYNNEEPVDDMVEAVEEVAADTAVAY